MSRNLLKLQQLIYGATGKLFIKSISYAEIMKEVIEIKSASTVDGFILNDSFVSNQELTSYTANDWRLIYAQYQCTYGFPSEEDLELVNEHRINSSLQNKDTFVPIDESFSSKTDRIVHIFNPESTEPNALVKYLAEIMSSKAVLRANQIEMLEVAPEEFLTKAFEIANFTINETRMMIVNMLVQLNYQGKLFSSPDDIVRFIYANYSIIRSDRSKPTDTKLNKTLLSKVDFDIPTSMRKKILNTLNQFTHFSVAPQFKKYLQFWKRVFKQCSYASEAKMTKRFPFAFNIKEKLYKSTIKTENTDIEYFRSIGDLGTAFSIELNNPGQMLRRISSYVRYPIGAKYARKRAETKANEYAQSFTVVKSDITEIIEDQMFDETLLMCNPKLLFQVLALLRNKTLHKAMSVKKCNGKQVNYLSQPLPGFDKRLTDIVVDKIKIALSAILQRRNSVLGKIYIDKSVANFPLQFSGRLDTATSMSGAYYPSGSKISLGDIIANAKNPVENPIIRFGIAWKGECCDIDLSTSFLGDKNQYQCYFGNPQFTYDGELVAVSSGDITSCRRDVFSVEFIDLDYAKFKEINDKFKAVDTIYNSINCYSNIKFSDLDCYFFLQVIDKSKRVAPGNRQVTIKLDECDFAVKLNDASRLCTGLMIDVDTDMITVINKSVEIDTYQSIMHFQDKCIEAIESKVGTQIFFNEALELAVDPEQIVDKVADANTVITGNQYHAFTDNIKSLNIATNAEQLEDLIF